MSGSLRRPGALTLDQVPPPEDERGDTERQVDQKRQPPVVRFHEHAAERWAEPGGGRRRRAPEPDGVRAALGGEGLDDERERRRDEQRGAGGLHAPERDQHRERRSGRAEHRRRGEEHHARGEDAPSPEDVREPPGRNEERSEDDVVTLSTQDSDPIELSGNESRMLGNATFTIVASRNASIAPNDATTNAPFRLMTPSRSAGVQVGRTEVFTSIRCR